MDALSASCHCCCILAAQLLHQLVKESATQRSSILISQYCSSGTLLGSWVTTSGMRRGIVWLVDRGRRGGLGGLMPPRAKVKLRLMSERGEGAN